MNEKIKESLETAGRLAECVGEIQPVDNNTRKLKFAVGRLINIQKEIIEEVEKLQEAVKKLNGEQSQRRYLTGKENKFSKL